jgi:hypothetical protein
VSSEPADIRHELFGVELGMSISCVATAFLAVFTVALSLALARIEGRSPLLAVSQLLGGLGVVLLIFISCCLWIGAAYRAGVAAPDVTVGLNDAAWFGFLVGWACWLDGHAWYLRKRLRRRSAEPAAAVARV